VIAENETVHLYLQLQRGHVLDALKAADGSVRSDPPPSAPASTSARRTRRPPKPFKLGRVRTPDSPVPWSVHAADCHMAGPFAHAVNGMEARIAITDGNLKVCLFCRPGSELGLDTD
jgi:hypothetical protein